MLPEGIFNAAKIDAHGSHSYELEINNSRTIHVLCRKTNAQEAAEYTRLNGAAWLNAEGRLYYLFVAEYDQKALGTYARTGEDSIDWHSQRSGFLVLEKERDLTKCVEDKVNKIYGGNRIMNLLRTVRSYSSLFLDEGIPKRELP
jgi:hypothetical protein